MSQGFLHSSQSNSQDAPLAEAAATSCTDQSSGPSPGRQKDTAVKKASKVSACADPAGFGARRAFSYL